MSVQALAWVFDYSEAAKAERLVLLAMANHYSRDGLCCPSFDTLAREARLSRSTVIRAVGGLEDGGHITVGRGGGRTNPNHYRITGFDKQCQIDTVSREERVSSTRINSVTGDTGTKREPRDTPNGDAAPDGAAPNALFEAEDQELGQGQEQSIVARLVAGYVADVQAVEHGHSPPREDRGAAGRAARRALDNGETPETIATCLGIAAREGKNPSNLGRIISDYHSKRPRRQPR